MAYFRRAAADNVVRAELFFDPQTHTARGVPIGAVIGGLARALRAGRARARHLERPDPLLPAPPERGRGAADAAGRAALSRALHRRRPRQQRARPSAGEVRPGLRRGRPARPAPGRPCRRGGPAGLHRERARRPQGRAHRPRRALPGGPGAGAAARRRAGAAHRLPALQRQALRLRRDGEPPPAGAARRRHLRHRQLRRSGLFRRLHERQLPGGLRRLAPSSVPAEAYALARNSFEASFVDAAARAAMTVRLDQLFARFA